MVCKTVEADIISMDICARLPFLLKHKIVSQAKARNMVFEGCYGPALADRESRRYFVSNGVSMVNACKYQHMILSCGSPNHMLVRGPYDVVNMGALFGLDYSSAKHLVSHNCRQALRHADNRVSHRSIVCGQSAAQASVESAVVFRGVAGGEDSTVRAPKRGFLVHVTEGMDPEGDGAPARKRSKPQGAPQEVLTDEEDGFMRL